MYLKDDRSFNFFLFFFPCQALFFCSGQESFDERGILLIGCGVYLKKSHLRIEYDIRSELILSNTQEFGQKKHLRAN